MIKKTKLHRKKTTRILKGLSKMKRTMKYNKKGGAPNISEKLSKTLKESYETFKEEYDNQQKALINQNAIAEKKLTAKEITNIFENSEKDLLKLNALYISLNNQYEQTTEEYKRLIENLNFSFKKIEKLYTYTYIPESLSNNVKVFEYLFKQITQNEIYEILNKQSDMLQYIVDVINVLIIKTEQKKYFDKNQYIKEKLQEFELIDLNDYQPLLDKIKSLKKSKSNSYTQTTNTRYVNSTPRNSNGIPIGATTSANNLNTKLRLKTGADFFSVAKELVSSINENGKEILLIKKAQSIVKSISLTEVNDLLLPNHKKSQTPEIRTIPEYLEILETLLYQNWALQFIVHYKVVFDIFQKFKSDPQKPKGDIEGLNSNLRKMYSAEHNPNPLMPQRTDYKYFGNYVNCVKYKHLHEYIKEINDFKNEYINLKINKREKIIDLLYRLMEAIGLYNLSMQSNLSKQICNKTNYNSMQTDIEKYIKQYMTDMRKYFFNNPQVIEEGLFSYQKYYKENQKQRNERLYEQIVKPDEIVYAKVFKPKKTNKAFVPLYEAAEKIQLTGSEYELAESSSNSNYELASRFSKLANSFSTNSVYELASLENGPQLNGESRTEEPQYAEPQNSLRQNKESPYATIVNADVNNEGYLPPASSIRSRTSNEGFYEPVNSKESNKVKHLLPAAIIPPPLPPRPLNLGKKPNSLPLEANEEPRYNTRTGPAAMARYNANIQPTVAQRLAAVRKRHGPVLAAVKGVGQRKVPSTRRAK